jgi:hypothetical protein
MMGDVHVIGDDLTSVMNVSSLTWLRPAFLISLQLWLDNESTMTGMSSTLHRIATTLSGWTNSLFGQTLSRARLNAIASYDQSNDLFRVRTHPAVFSFTALIRIIGFPLRGDDVLLCSLGP